MDTSKPNVKPYLLTRSLFPENQETPIQFIDTDFVPNKLFYRRNHFSYPALTYSNYWLPINGSVTKPTVLSMQDILQMPSKTLHVVLECSGDKRRFFKPKVFGEQFEKGAISQGIWKGVPLRFLLERSGIREGAREVVFEGYDFGERTDLDDVFPYARSLPLEKALHPDTIIAYEYNNKPIPFKHGYPLRLIVPQWYGMASVKWIKQIRVIDSNFTGPFQVIDYMYYPNRENNKDAFPVREINVNSTIQKPLDMQILNTGKHLIKGIAWTGNGFISKVEISVDGGSNWLTVTLEPARNEGYGWQSWSYEWNAANKGEYVIQSKATDSYGRTQPANPFWNRKGYGYNAVDKIKVKVE
ncbi:sulfite oxidase [Bacillus sp. FJAT-18017]|uniref:sulfite oxidase n=1 Tax=Bacillus sp. FJAT-18017 TaxID=1705566 RepID=UPI0006B0329A|nr:sulfite oxidase [Bacillus sp. FJAT-18017]ALC91593.1 sulfite oxidase [Bacillus sp. FJAT-18017]